MPNSAKEKSKREININCPKSVKGLNISIICVAAVTVILFFVMIFAFSALSQAISDNGGFDNIASLASKNATSSISSDSSLSEDEAQAQQQGNMTNENFIQSLSLIYQNAFNAIVWYLIIGFILSIGIIVFASLVLYFCNKKNKYTRCIVFSWLILASSVFIINLPIFVLSIISLVFVYKNRPVKQQKNA